jgi:preprotein translocase subunit SecD
MNRRTCLLTAAALLGIQSTAWTRDRPPTAKSKPDDGVYAVERDGETEKSVLPLKEGEIMLVNRHRYQKNPGTEPPRYLVVRAAPDVALDLAGEAQADKDGDEVVAIRLKLRPKAAAALEKLTRDRRGKQLAIVVGGDVVTVHKVREVIPNGDVQITSCSPGGAEYLLKQLQGRDRGK